MEKVIIDSCIFFKMIKYNDIYLKYGKESVDEHIKAQKNELINLQNEILSLIDTRYVNKNENLNFMDLIDGYKAFANSNLRNSEKQIKSCEMAMQGKFLDNKTNKIKHVELSKERIQHFKDEKEKHEKIVEYFTSSSKKFLDVKTEFKELKDLYMVGKLYQKVLKGEMKLFVVPTSQKEIVNHTDNKNKENNDEFLMLSSKQINNMLKLCTAIKIENKNVIKMVTDLAEKFRTNTSNNVAMQNDVNSVGEFGDSQIVAESNLSGMVLVTQNKKDFIKSNSFVGKGGVRDNNLIRNHIIGVAKNSPECTDAYVYSPEEILSGNYLKPTKQSEFVKLVENKHKNYLEYND